MKAVKYAAVFLAIGAVLALLGWFLRDTIIRQISGPILQEYGLTLTDVSLDALATRDAAIGHLELMHENGMRIAVDDLMLPLSTSPKTVKMVTARRVAISTPTTGDKTPIALAELVDRALLLSRDLPNTEVTIGELSMKPYPTVRELYWETTEGGQSLNARIDATSLAIEISHTDRGMLTASTTDARGDVVRQSVRFGVERTDTGITVSGESSLDLSAAVPIARAMAASFDVSAAEIVVETGAAELSFSADIPHDATQPTLVNGILTPMMPLRLTYAEPAQDPVSVSVGSASPIKLETNYPQLEWSADQMQASLRLSYQQWNDIAVDASNVDCRNGPRCSMNINAYADNIEFDFAAARRLELSALQDIVFDGDEIGILIRPDAELVLTEVSAPGADIEKLDARTISGAELRLLDGDWRFAADSVEGQIHALSPQDDITYSAPASLRNIAATEIADSLSLQSAIDAASGEVRIGGLAIVTPGFDGDVLLENDQFSLSGETNGLHREATITARHDLDKASGSLSVQNGVASLDDRKLSARVSPQFDWDISAGIVSGEVKLAWLERDAGWKLDGESSIRLSELAGNYEDTVFTGLSTDLAARYDSASGFDVEPASVVISLIEIGLPIEDISADYTLHPDIPSVDIDNLRMSAFGGVVEADAFSYHPGRESNALLLRARSIELTELLTLKEFEAIELSGSISAELPVTVEGTDVTIAAGQLNGEAPGGVIRYTPEVVPGDDSSIGFVTRALSNFEYETLTSEVHYDRNGDLMLQMRLAGRNPDLEDNRPIVLNLGVENNVPQMLRSLQAARAVEEILESKLAK